MTKSFEVGYGKPPRHKQFKKGTSGNPAGRPRERKDKSLLGTLEKMLSKKILITENGQTMEISLKEAYYRRLVTDAINGKPSAVKLLHRDIAEAEKIQKECEQDKSIKVTFVHGLMDANKKIVEL